MSTVVCKNAFCCIVISGTAYSDDTASVFSVNSVTNLWSADKVGRVYIQTRQNSNLSTDTTCTEQIELSEM